MSVADMAASGCNLLQDSVTIIKEQFVCNCRNDILARRKLENLLMDSVNDFCNIILHGVVLNCVDVLSNSAASGTSLAVLIENVHEKVVEQLASMQWPIRCPDVPYRYFSLLNLTVGEKLKGTQFDMNFISDEDASTVGGSDDSDCGYVASGK